MYIPSTTHIDNAISRLVEDSASFAPSKQWSSTIGVVTAIIGNILISFALNTQRYAHIRLGREREEQDEKRSQARRRNGKVASYGTQQSEIAKERSKANAKSEPAEYPLEDSQDSSETDPLIPSVHSLDSRKSSASSEETAKQDDGEDEDTQERKSYLRSPIWWLGIGMMTIGEAGNFLAYGFAPASIVSPLGVVALVSNCLIAPLLLHERFRWRDGMGVVIAVAGCVVVVMSASESNPKLTPDAIWHLISQWEFETYFGITVVVIIALCFASNRFGDKTVLIDIGLVGLFGGYTALSTKGVASLISNDLWRVVTFPITYLLVVILFSTAVMQIKYVNRALQRFNATMVIPTQFVMFTIFVIVGSAILYRDFERTTTQDAIKFIGGCALTFIGVWFITSGRGDSGETDEEMGEDEDAINLVDEEGIQPEIREREDNVDRRQSLIAGSSQVAPPNVQIPSEPASPLLDFEDSPLRSKTAGLQPANAAAIHSQSTSDLPQEATDSTNARPQPPPMHATTSAPVIPTTTTSSSFRPKTPLKRGITEAESPTKVPQTPTTPTARHPAAQSLDPNGSNRILSRHSVSGLLPGPFTSPLSSSLSAIVADSLRRGVDQAPGPSSLRRRSFKLRRKATDAGAVGSAKRRSVADAAAPKRHSIASGQMDFDEDAEELRRSAGSPPGRIRSFSATIGDILGSGKRSRMESRESVPEQRREEEE